MATIRDPKTKPLVGLKNKMIASGLLRFRGERVTAETIELELIDYQTGQIALVTIAEVNRGTCPLCGHVGHENAKRCEAVRAFTKDPCDCHPFYGRFPAENRTQADLDSRTSAWTRRDLTSTREPSSEARRRTGQSLEAHGSDDTDVAAAGRSGEGTASSSGPRSPLARADELVDPEAERLADYHRGLRAAR